MSGNDRRTRKRGEEENQGGTGILRSTEHDRQAPETTTAGNQEHADDSSPDNDSEMEEEVDDGDAADESMETADQTQDNYPPNGNPESIFDVLLKRRTRVMSVVEDWKRDYVTNREDGIRDLMQFFIHSTGAMSRIRPGGERCADLAEMVLSLSRELSTGTGVYPLTMSGWRWKRFRQRFCDFVHQLVMSCQSSVMHDSYMMDRIITLLIELSVSEVRALRHTATLAAMKLMTALVDVAVGLSTADTLTQSRDQNFREKKESIRNMMNRLFECVFVKRYKDVHPAIRSICLGEIGTWIQKFPQEFSKREYIKFIGWSLGDPAHDVQLRCLQSLLPFYANPNDSIEVDRFTRKFKDHIMILATDGESAVSVHAIKLIIGIHRFKNELLTDEDYERIYDIVYTPDPQAARAAAEFLHVVMLQSGLETPIVTKQGKTMSRYSSALKDLVVFFIESEVPELGAYLVDSLIDISTIIKDWECYTDLLLEEPADQEYKLDDEQVSMLIEIMRHAVKQSATGEPPVGRRNRRRQFTERELSKAQDEQNRLTEHFYRLLPKILDKYAADVDKLAKLLELPRYFDLKIYTVSGHDKFLHRLLRVMRQIVERHVDDEVLRACSDTYETFCDGSSAIQSLCKPSRSTLSDELRQSYDTMHSNLRKLPYDAIDDTINEDIVIGVTIAMKKLVLFHDFDNLGASNLWDLLHEPWVSAYAGEQTRLPLEGVRLAIMACESSLLCETNILGESVGLDVADSTLVSRLRARIRIFMENLSALLVDSPLPLQEDAFLRICDMLVIYSHKANVTSGSEQIFYEPSDSMVEGLKRFVEEQVFAKDIPVTSDAQRQIDIEVLKRGRELLAVYCKLCIHGVIGIPQLQLVFRNYKRSFDEYTDIIKGTLEKVKEIDAKTCAITVVDALFSRFEALTRDPDHRIQRRSAQFVDLKDMAKRFAMIFGLGNGKMRQAIVALHRYGIQLAANHPAEESNEVTPPPNADFIEVLHEFVRNLMKRDKMLVRDYLDQEIPVRSPVIGDWEPHRMYRDALFEAEEVGPMNDEREPAT